MVSWRATASSRTVESRARRVAGEDARAGDDSPHGVEDALGRSGGPQLVAPQHQHGGMEGGVGQHQAGGAFQAMSVSRRRTAWRSDSPSREASTITVAMTSAGTEGRPRPEGNRSANISSANSARRCSARRRAPNPPPSRCRHRAAASSSWRSGETSPAWPHSIARRRRSRIRRLPPIAQRSPSPSWASVRKTASATKPRRFCSRRTQKTSSQPSGPTRTGPPLPAGIAGIRCPASERLRSLQPVRLTFYKLVEKRVSTWNAVRGRRSFVPGTTMSLGRGGLPHDLVQLLVEGTLGLDRGFWGSVASGATFRSTGRKRTRPGRAVIVQNRRQLDEAEHVVGDHVGRWVAGSPTPCRQVLDDFEERWRSLGDGEGMVIDWPTLTCIGTTSASA